MTHQMLDRRLALIGLLALPLAACAQPRAQVDETPPPPRIVRDPKAELERGRGR